MKKFGKFRIPDIDSLIRPYDKDSVVKSGQWYECHFYFKIKRNKNRSILVDEFLIKKVPSETKLLLHGIDVVQK